jgi:hypothetical protein
MSEVDSVSNSGLYPALPIADPRSHKDGSAGRRPSDKGSHDSESKSADAPDSNHPRPPKSLIDEYA